jgi:hypothetical protein
VKLTVNISTLVFGTMKTVHLGISGAYATRDPEAISSSVMVVEGSRTSTVTDAVQSRVRIKAVPILLVAKLVIDVIDWVYNVLLLRNR